MSPTPPRRGGNPAPRRAAAPGAVAADPVAVRRRRLPEFTRLSSIEAGVAAVLFLASAGLGWNAVRGYFIGSNLRAGLYHYGANQLDSAIQNFKNAAGWAPDLPTPPLLLAKMKVDGEALDEAEEIYRKLAAIEGAGAETVAAAHVGLGVVQLRRADAALVDEVKAPADRRAEPAERRKAAVAAARTEFNEAVKLDGGLPESGIGLAHAALLAGDPAEAQRRLSALADPGPRVTLDGLIDLYIGTGLALRRTKAPVGDVLAAFHRATAVAPGWRLGQINLTLLEAENLAQPTFPGKDAVDRESEIRSRMKRLLDEAYRDAGMAAELRQAALEYYLAAGCAIDRAGPQYLKRATDMIEEARRVDREEFRVPLTQASLYLKQTHRPNLGRGEADDFRRRAAMAYEQAVKLAQGAKDVRALAWNNLAVLRDQLADRNGAQQAVEEAYRLDPKRPEILRNRAILLRLAGKDDASGKSAEAYLKLKPDDAAARKFLEGGASGSGGEEEEKEKPK